MGHPLMYEDRVAQKEIDLRNQQLSQKNQRINELGEELEGFKFLVGELQELVMVEQTRVRELEAWREQVRGKLGELLLALELIQVESPGNDLADAFNDGLDRGIQSLKLAIKELGLAKEGL